METQQQQPDGLIPLRPEEYTIESLVLSPQKWLSDRPELERRVDAWTSEQEEARTELPTVTGKRTALNATHSRLNAAAAVARKEAFDADLIGSDEMADNPACAYADVACLMQGPRTTLNGLGRAIENLVTRRIPAADVAVAEAQLRVVKAEVQTIAHRLTELFTEAAELSAALQAAQGAYPTVSYSEFTPAQHQALQQLAQALYRDRNASEALAQARARQAELLKVLDRS